MIPFIAPPITVPQVALYSQAQESQASTSQIKSATTSTTVPDVPFYSQFNDIKSPKWQKVGCGITSLAMVIDFYKPDSVSVNALLKQGLAAGAYKWGAGWKYEGLIKLAQKHGLNGNYYDLSMLDAQAAFDQFQNFLKDGPVILSVRNRFNPKSKVPHLVVIDGIDNNIVYYNDPGAKMGKKEISTADFLKGWKKKVIVVRVAKEGSGNNLTLK